jgi:PIN domain nuclease of toxin-antitoxin system
MDPANEFLSMASVWEIAIKAGLKKLALSNRWWAATWHSTPMA